jgi:hypothetical protein
MKQYFKTPHNRDHAEGSFDMEFLFKILEIIVSSREEPNPYLAALYLSASLFLGILLFKVWYYG